MNLEAMVANNQEVLVQEVGGVLYADSLGVAERFGKRHDHVVRDIEGLIHNILTEKDNPNFGGISKTDQDFFIQDTYTDSMNRERKHYWLTRDGFSLLVMGFTGTAAFHWKLLYIEAFNKMEAKLRGPVQPITAAQIDATINKAVDRLRDAILEALQLEEPKTPVMITDHVERPAARRVDFLRGNRDALPNLLTVYDIRDFLGVGQKFAYELIHKDGFPAKKIGTSYQIPKEDFLKWYDEQ